MKRPPKSTAAKAFSHVANGDTDLTVFITDDLEGHEDKVAGAFALLEESETARLLLRTAVRCGYAIAMDAQMKDRGGADFEQKIVFINPDVPLEEMALTIAHELAHVSQKENADLDIDVLRDTPHQSIRTLMAMEADARAYEMRVALELAYGVASHAQMMEVLLRKSENPLLDALVGKALPLLPHKPSFEAMMAGAFKCFYGYAPQRRTHEDIILGKLVRVKSCGGHAVRDPAELMRRVDHHARPYLPESGYIDLALPAFDTVSPQGQAVIASLAVPAPCFKLP